jgi:N-methylhydantoinase B
MDTITMQVIGGRLASIAAEMSQKMIRMSFSILIKESEDIGCAITDADGNQLAEADTSPLTLATCEPSLRRPKSVPRDSTSCLTKLALTACSRLSGRPRCATW